MTKNSVLVLSLLLLLIGCEDQVTLCSQACEDTANGPTATPTGVQPVVLGPGERESVKVIVTKLPPGAHIDISAKNGILTFRQDTNPAHLSANKQSIAIQPSLGKTQHAFVVISPEAEALLKARAASKP
jgi:hypothetical protein